MVVCESNISNIIGGIENTGGVPLHHRRKLKQRFDIIKKLGQGTYGKVQLGINKETGQEVAIKTIKKCKIETEADLVRIRREIQIMSSVQHPNIIHIYEVFENREKMVLVMEYAAGGELYDYLSERKVLTEEEARRIFRQIVTAVYYCHKHKICHRDLKLENILLDEHGSAKIADFGLSNVFDERRLLSTFCGSPLYASPEIVQGTPYHGPEADCWSLGVLLYTLVYGAMPFDGSNFKRLVRQISHGDYFEPKKPSPASPLIREMLTVSPDQRANIEKICAHWWVNLEYKESCLDIAEELANQTPVRLDLLLSLAPPPPQVGSDKLVIADEASTSVPVAETAPVPTRSQSVGSLMELAPSAERRIRDLQTSSPKRKLEVTVSTENANQSSTGAKRKERPVKKEKEPIVDVLPPQTELLSQLQEVCDTLPSVSNIEKSLTEPIRDMEVDPIVEGADTVIDDKIPEIEGAACKELIEEMNRREAKIEEKPVTKEKEKSPKKVCDKEINKVSPEKETDKPEKQKVKKVIKKIVTKKVPSEKKVVENNIVDTKKVAEIKSPVTEQVETKKIEEPTKVEEKKLVENITKPQEIKKDDIEKIEEKKAEIPKQIDEPKITEGVKKVEEPVLDTKPVEQEEIKNGERVSPPTKPIERRRSKIFETAEKLQNMAKGNDPAPKVIEKPKKIFIPGVNVGGFKKEFERKASLTSTAPLLKQTNSVTKVPATQTVTNGADTKSTEKTISKKVEPTITPPEPISPPKPEPPIEKLVPEPSIPPAPANEEDELKKKREKAVNIISNAINKEGARKSKSRPSVLRKTPLPFGASGRSASGNITMLPLSPTELVSSVKNAISEESVESADINKLSKTPSDSKKSTVEITLRSSTLPPQRKTAKAEIKLNYPSPKPATMEFKTEVAHHIEAPQESFDRFTPMKFRSSSCDPEMKPKESPKERIIPISFEKEENKSEIQQPTTASKPPMPKTSHSMRSLHRHGSISRQSTQDSDSESCITQSESMEPIRKSPKEYIIPIAVEGGGYVTPRSASTEPSESSSGISSLGRQSIFKFGRPKRMSSILTDEDESPGSTLHRHNSIGRDSDTEEPRKEPFHMHRLRSSRPTRKVSLEHTDSLSSAEEDDDDDGFEILTAENLFSTLLSRVRNLTQRLNVEDNGRLGFPSSRLLGDFDRGTKMFMNDPLSRYSLLDQTFNRERRNARSPSASSSAPWRRSVSRDLANDIEKVFNNTPTASATLPRGKSRERSDINLSPEDTMALSYLTPGLSRRIRKHLFSSQIPSTHSSRNLSRHKDEDISEDQTEKDITSNVSNEKQSSSNSLKNKIINRLNRSISQDRGTSSKFLKSQDKVNSNFTSLNESFPDKTDLYYYRSLSKDSNENKNSTSEQTKNSNSNNNNNSLNDIITLSSLYNSRMPVKNITPIVPNSSTPSSSSKYSSNSNYNDVGSKVSRFLKSSFHEDYTRKNKEKEAQKVLREIRKKRSAKEDGVAKEDLKNEEKITSYIDSNSRLESKMQNEIERTLEMNQNNIEKTTDNVKSSENIRKSRISRLLRPKSYPNDYVEQKDNYGINKSESPVCNGVQKSEEISSSLTSSVDKTKTSLQKQNTQSTKTRASSSHVKPKAEKKSKVENTIRSLRERSLPHDTEYCATESNLIKRAISLEDFTTLSPPVSFKDKALQTSRKSVSKILGLFEKCDNQIKNKQKTKKSTKSEESTNKEITDIQNEEIKKNDSNKKTFIKKLTKDNTNKTKTTENNETNCDTNSRIPVSGIKKSENSKTNGLEKQPNPFEALKNKDDMYKSERKSNRDRIFSLKLDLKDDYDFKKERENDISNLITPSDDGEMSMCSDSHYHDSSPNSTLKIFSDDEECESVSDRIHRKSFYSRFNEKKKKKKSSSAGSYDFKEYLAKLDEQLTDSSSSRKNKSYDHRSSSTRSFNNYSTLRQPASYSRQTSLPTGSESHSGLYSTYNSYMDGYRSNKEKRSSIASYLPTVSKGSLSEVKDTSGKTTKLTSQKEQSNNKFSEKNNDSNTNEKLVSPGPSNRNSYISQN